MSPAEKAQATACAKALLAGIRAEPSRDDRGRPTVILSRDAWCREIEPQQLADALAEARQLAGLEAANA
jgi:hypothetical protein